MNLLDIQLKFLLNAAKTKPDPITHLNDTCGSILTEVKDSSPERMRYWINFIRNIHPLVDEYLDGQKLSSSLSDVLGEHILNTQADTQTVDLAYYMDDTQQYQPTPIRRSIVNKIPNNQLKMIEDSYIKLNKNYATIMSIFFSSKDDNTWTIPRVLAHEFYNTQDFLGFYAKIKIKDVLLDTFNTKFKSRLNLLNHIIPLKESIIITNDSITLKIEDKDMVVDNFGNKIINIPDEISNEVLQPTYLLD